MGGGLGCFIENCKETYHYLCAKKSDCLFIQDEFICYCSIHKNDPDILEKYDLNSENMEEEDS